MNLKPFRDTLFVKEIGRSEEKSLIVRPDHPMDIFIGEVVAVSDGYWTQMGQFVPLEVKIGDKVYFQRPNAIEMTVDGEKFLILQQGTLLCREERKTGEIFHYVGTLPPNGIEEAGIGVTNLTPKREPKKKGAEVK